MRGAGYLSTTQSCPSLPKDPVMVCFVSMNIKSRTFVQNFQTRKSLFVTEYLYLKRDSKCSKNVRLESSKTGSGAAIWATVCESRSRCSSSKCGLCLTLDPKQSPAPWSSRTCPLPAGSRSPPAPELPKYRSHVAVSLTLTYWVVFHAFLRIKEDPRGEKCRPS